MFDWLRGSEAHREPAGCRIEIDGTEIAGDYRFITEVTVDASRLRASTARLSLVAPADETGRWTVQDDDAIRSGATIRIDAVFGPRRDEAFRGYIQQIACSYPENRGEARVTLTCRDETLALDSGHRRRVWGSEDTPTTDAAIVTEILSDGRLQPAAGNQPGRSGLVLSQNGSDIAFLGERARENGYELYSWAGVLYFGPRRLELSPQPTILVYAGQRTNCLSFDVSDDIHHADELAFDIAPESGSEPETVSVTPDLPLMGRRAASGEDTSAGANRWRMDRTATPDRDRAEAIARARVNDEQMRVAANGTLDGSLYGHVLRFGMPVAVGGVGAEFGGRYYVDEVMHRFAPTGYRQEFKLSRNAYGDDSGGVGGVLDAVLGG